MGDSCYFPFVCVISVPFQNCPVLELSFFYVSFGLSCQILGKLILIESALN